MPQYRLSLEYQQEIQETMKELLRQRHIRKSRSPWNSPLIVVKKKDGTYCVVIDYRYLNSVTKPQGYRMKDAYEMLERLAGKKFLSAIDLLKGYYHIGVAEECRYLTAFHIPGPEGGNFECVTMPFGLRDAPPTFQQFIDEVFKDILADFAVIYMDDLGAGSETREEHLGHLRQTFQIMRENQLYAKKKKCYFMQKRIPFLGHFISEAGIEMNPEKIEAVKAWPPIKTIKQLRGFLGLTGYYQKFIKDYSKKALQLTKLLKDTEKFEWTEDQEKAKQELINALTSAPILKRPDYTKKYTVTTDVSDHAIGAVLSQEHGPIAFLSKTFTDVERRWSTYDKELFAIVYTLEKWQHYLRNNIPFEVITDNYASTFIQKQQRLSAKQARWVQTLEEFNFKIIHKPGAQNLVADALSRKDIQVIQLYGISQNDSMELLDQIKAISQNLPRKKGMVRQPDGLITTKDDRIYIPGNRQLKTTILQEYHEGLGGHFGFRKTMMNLLKTYYWEKMHQDVQKFIKSCNIYQRTKTSTQKLYGEMKPISPPVEKFSTYTMDFIGPLPTIKNRFNGIMVIVNKLMKFTSITPIKMTFSAEDITRLFFEKIVSRFRMPESLIFDRDPRFTSKFWKSLWEYCQTKLALSTAYHPQTDGQTERANRTLQQVIWSSVNYHRNNWDEYLSAVEFAINNTYQESTKTTPYMLMYGVQPRMPIDRKITVKTDAPSAKKFITEM